MAVIKDKKGFTLMELMVAMTIGMTILAAVTTTFMSQAKIYNAQEQVNQMEQNARGALDVITRELKMAGYNPTGSNWALYGYYGITYSSWQLIIEADLDSSGLPDTTSSTANEKITYVYDSTTRQITRKVGAGTAQLLADNITAFGVTYYTSDGTTQATDSASVRQVKISITARTAKPDPDYTTNNGYREYAVTTTITPPNLAL